MLPTNTDFDGGFVDIVAVQVKDSGKAASCFLGFDLFDITETTGTARPSIKHNGQFNALTKLIFTFTSCAKVEGDGDEMEYICNNSHYMKTFRLYRFQVIS
jgi:hypothetical protein